MKINRHKVQRREIHRPSKAIRHSIKIATSIFIILSSGCLNQTNTLEEKIIKTLNSAKNEKNMNGFDLMDFSTEKVIKICIQTPYMAEKYFAERVGVKVNDFSEVDDSHYKLWIFLNETQPVQIKIHRWKQFNFDKESTKRCSISSFIIINQDKSQLELT